MTVPRVVVFLVLFAAVLPAGCRRKTNPVTEYLKSVEVQCETEEQRQTVVRALQDVLTLPEQELGRRRYADYAGRPEAWDLPTLLARYLVPDRQGRTFGPDFYADVKSPVVQPMVRRILGRLAGRDSATR